MTESIACRVGLIRAEMKKQNLDGFIVPLADAFMSHYLPDHLNLVKWASGFSGSHGSAVICQDKAFLMTSSFYITQAPIETDPDIFTIVETYRGWNTDWAANMQPGQRVGYDPWLHSADWVEQTRRALSAKQVELVPVTVNCVAAAWVDRPADFTTPIEAHPLEFSGEESASKRQRVAAKIAADKLDVFLMARPDSTCWLLNIRDPARDFVPIVGAFGLLYPDGTVDYYLDAQRVTPEVLAHFGPDVRLKDPVQFGPDLDALKGKRVGVDVPFTTGWVTERLRKAGAEMVNYPDPAQVPKACKNETEVNGMRAAHLRDGVALTTFLAWLDAQPPGTIDELTAEAKLDGLRASGNLFRGRSFATIPSSGPHSGSLHYSAVKLGNRTLQNGEFFLCDSGGHYRDGTTDVTRTIAIGEISHEMKDRYTRVLKCHIAMARAIFPQGTVGAHIDTLQRAPMWAAGLDWGHRGHGVGSYLDVHEGPVYIGQRDVTAPLQIGMVLSNEPGYYKRNEFGVRIETLAVVVPHKVEGGEVDMMKFETLTLAPIDKRPVLVELLTAEEREWFNAYHARVREKLAPLVAPEVAAWLEKATAPL